MPHFLQLNQSTCIEIQTSFDCAYHIHTIHPLFTTSIIMVYFSLFYLFFLHPICMNSWIVSHNLKSFKVFECSATMSFRVVKRES